MACYFDARDWVKWSTIDLTLTCGGSYTYGGDGGTYSGSISGSSTIKITRVAFDPNLVPDYAQVPAATDFVTFRQRRGCPFILFGLEINEAVGTGNITISHTTPDGTEADSAPGTFLLRLANVEDSSCDCQNPESLLVEALGYTTASDPPFRFHGFAYYLDGEVRTPISWAGDSFSHEEEYDISVDGDIVGSGTSTLEVSFNA